MCELKVVRCRGCGNSIFVLKDGDFVEVTDEENEYFIRDTRDYKGNSILWWAKGGGYTTDIESAEVFSKLEAEKICNNREKFKMELISEVVGVARLSVDIQDFKFSKVGDE